MIKVPFDEQETTVTIDYVSKVAYVYSSMPKEASRLRMMAAANPNETEIILDNNYGVEISMPIKWVKIKAPVKRPDALSRLRGEKS